jgi:hypothetical protein
MPVIDLGRVIGPQGPQGETGAQGIRGETGLPGPNQITISTATPLTGVLTGNGSAVGVMSVDNAPTEDSNNLVTSGGVYDAIDALTAADVGALASDGTAVGASNLRHDYSILGTSGRWYKFLDFPIEEGTSRKFVLLLSDGGYAYQGIVNCLFNRSTGVSINGEVTWWARTGYDESDIRFDFDQDNGRVVMYVRKRSNTSTLVYVFLSSTRSAYYDISSYFLTVEVTIPATAIAAGGVRADLDGAGNSIADGRLWFSSVAVSAGTSQQILSISDAKITADYVLARIEWTNPSYITAGYTWTTGAGNFTLSGTATAATTANILLVRKGN